MNKKLSKLLMLSLGIVIGSLPPPALPDDIDLFVGSKVVVDDNPNVLFVLDNTANWSGNDQKFPGGKQGEAELQAIKSALTGLGAAGREKINVGIMAFPAAETGSSPHGGYIRSAIRTMDEPNFTNFSALLDYMSANISDSQHERQNSNLFYGNLMADAHNYLKGLAPIALSSTVVNTGNADSEGYDANYTKFKAPPTGSGCGKTYIIFIANPNSNGPATDPASNTALLASLGGTTTQSPHDLFASNNITSNLGFASACYPNTPAGVSACTTAQTTGSGAYATQCNDEYLSCACDSVVSTATLPSCATGTQRYTVFGNSSSTYTPAPPATVSCPASSGSTSWASCTALAAGASNAGCGTNQHKFPIYGTKSVTSADTGTQTSCTNDTETISTTYTPNPPSGAQACPANTLATVANSGNLSGSYTLWNGCTSSSTIASSCGTTPPSDRFQIIGTKTTGSASNTGTFSACSSSGYGTLTSCPAGYVAGTCVYAESKSNSGCSGGNSRYAIWGLKTTDATVASGASTGAVTACSDQNPPASPVYTPNPPASATCPSDSGNVTWAGCAPSAATASTAGCGTNQHKFQIYGTQTTANVDTGTFSSCTNDTVGGASQANLGNTFTCTATAGGCNTSDYSSVAANYSSLSCGAPSTTTGNCPLGGVRQRVQGTKLGVTPTGNTGLFSSPKYVPLNANLWAKYMHDNNIASTFTIDVYNAKPSTVASELYYSMAQLGGGEYYAGTNASEITAAVAAILNKIQSVNTTFASAALPVNATNRAQNENQVFIGMFRPDPSAKPRWYGNLKKYQLIDTGTSIALGDKLGASAVNTTTGFINNCAVSFWTNDSGTYWQNVLSNTDFTNGKCSPNAFSPWSDIPDGPMVEKGAAGQIQRQGNDPAGAATYVINSNRSVRTVTAATVAGSTLPAFDSTNAPTVPSNVLNFIQGKDVTGEYGNPGVANVAATGTRPSMHGDVIHSRPLPINYGDPTGVVVYYGSNDGTFRAVKADDGKEMWSFVAPEFFSKLPRLLSNTPAVKFPGTIDLTATAKDYFFDGSVGVYQNADNSKVWIYPTMHRGGRMLYAFDVTTPDAPTFKWRMGCPNLTDDAGCISTDAADLPDVMSIGQTWSLPNVAFVKGFDATMTTPVIVMGGGYDKCEDENSGTPACGSPKGNAVYVLNANTGDVLATFPTTRSVAADVSLVDVNSDGSVDYAYAADTGGNIYRLSFVDGYPGLTSQPAANWTMTRVAYTNGDNRKFLFGPGVVPASGGAVYVTLGTGDREHPLSSQYPFPGGLATGDPGVLNRFYVYVDNLAASTAIDMDSASFADANNANCLTTKIYPGSALKGWYLDLNKFGDGEQTVTSSVIAAGLVTFSTNRPSAPAIGSCSNLGEARGYLLNLFNGSGAIGVSGSCGGTISNTFVGGGLPPSPVLATVPVGGVAHTVFIGAVQKDGSTSTIIQAQKIDPTIASKRKQVYWKKSGDN